MTLAVLEPASTCSLLTLSDLAHLLRVSERKIRTLVSKGILPKPIVLGERGYRWRSVDVENFLQGL